MNELFKLGRIVGTQGALKELDQADVFMSMVRHSEGDWGSVCKEDKESNDWALLQGDRLLSAWKDKRGRAFWIITEGDRSTTTVLLPEEY